MPASVYKQPRPDPLDRIELEIGDSKELTIFYPQIKIMRWDNEVNLSLRLANVPYALATIEIGEKIQWKTPAIEAHFYDLPTGYVFDILLNQKPPINKVEFSLETKGVVFFYQPPLTEEPPGRNWATVTPTEAFDKDGKRVAYRPENVVGSYAVYCSEPKDNIVGGKLYRAGKVGHLYRPYLTDAADKGAWGEIYIDAEKKVLTITVPQQFLDGAKYPVRVRL